MDVLMSTSVHNTNVCRYAVGCLIVQFFTDQFPWQGQDDILTAMLVHKQMLPQLEVCMVLMLNGLQRRMSFFVVVLNLSLCYVLR